MTKKMSLFELKLHLNGKNITAISYNIDTQSSEGTFPYGDLRVSFPFMYIEPFIDEILLTEVDAGILTDELIEQVHQNAPTNILINMLKLSCIEYVEIVAEKPSFIALWVTCGDPDDSMTRYKHDFILHLDKHQQGERVAEDSLFTCALCGRMASCASAVALQVGCDSEYDGETLQANLCEECADGLAENLCG